MSKRPLNLGSIVETEIQQSHSTSAKEAPTLQRISAPEGTKNISVRLDAERYARLRKSAYYTGHSHKDLMILAFDLWWEKYGETIEKGE